MNEYVYFPQEIAGILKSERLSWDDFWPEIQGAMVLGKRLVWSSNCIDFRYDPAKDEIEVAVSFGAKEKVQLSPQQFVQVIPRWVIGGPDANF